LTMAAIVANLRMMLAAGIIVITITIRIKPSPSVVTAAAENISGRHPYIAIKEMNAERNHSTNAFIAITGRKYDRIGFVMRKLIQNLDADANRRRFCQTYNDGKSTHKKSRWKYALKKKYAIEDEKKSSYRNMNFHRHLHILRLFFYCSGIFVILRIYKSNFLYLVLTAITKQTSLEILLDANILVLCESINVSTAGSNVFSTDSAIWKKFQEMFQKETTKINIKLDSLSIKVGSLVEDMKIIKNKIQLNQCEHFRRYVDYSTTLSKNITSMIKMIITRNVAIEYTASKVTPGKALMKDEHLYACIEDILLQNEFQGEVVTIKLLLKALSTSLSNAKDWDGHRKDRDGQRKDRNGQTKDQ
ncbi:hypothetical protein ALC53_01681, partial [Atta colombica]